MRASYCSLSNLRRFPSSLFTVLEFPQLILTAAGWAVTSAGGGEAQKPRVASSVTPGVTSGTRWDKAIAPRAWHLLPAAPRASRADHEMPLGAARLCSAPCQAAGTRDVPCPHTWDTQTCATLVPWAPMALGLLGGLQLGGTRGAGLGFEQRSLGTRWDLTAPLLSPHCAVGWQDGEERTGSPDVDLDNPGAPILETRGRGRARAPEQGVWNGSGGVPLLQQGHPKKGAQGHVQAAVGDLQEEPPSPEDHRGGHDLGSGWFWGRPAWPYPTGRVRGCGRCCPRSRFVRILKGICTHAER